MDDWLRPARAPKPKAKEEPAQEAKACSCSAVKPPAATAWTWTLSSLGVVVLCSSGALLALLVILLGAVNECRDMVRLLVQSQLGVSTRRVDV